jgi:hypothetical protein
VVDAFPLRLMIGAMLGWLDRRQQDTVAYLVEENRILRKQLQGTRLTLSNDERRRLARSWVSTRSARATPDRDDCDARHDSPVASTTDRAEMVVRHQSLVNAATCSGKSVA